MERNQKSRSRPGREHRPESSRRPYSDDQETYRNPRNEYRDDDRGDEFELSQSRDDRYRSEAYRSKPPAESRSPNWPHSRAGGHVSESSSSGEDRERQGQGEGPQGGSPHGSGSGREQVREPGYGSRQQGSVQFGAYGGPREQTVYTERRFGEDYSGRGGGNHSRSDGRIKDDICDELSSDPECDAEEIQIEVTDGVASLSGTVPSRRMKHRAEDIAEAARGVEDVDNRIRVTGRVGRSQRASVSRGQDDNESPSSNGRSRKES